MADNMLTAALSRQSGLVKELNTLANNIANADTAGFRSEGLIFSEYVKSLSSGDSMSMTRPGAKLVDLTQGALLETGDQLDLAIEGDGFFLIETNAGARLTRAGGFALNNAGEMVDADGRRLLDAGEAPIAIPAGTTSITISRDGSIEADGAAIGQVGVVTAPATGLMREGDNLFRAEEGYEPSANFGIVQGALEGSNVNAMGEFARLIEVQRAYEASKSFMDKESDRLKRMVEGLGQPQT
ncbi:MAG: flagellar hook-basal body complex protein [Pseudomonadota bacterium]